VVRSADFKIESTGVTPLPPPNSTIPWLPSFERMEKRPSGGCTKIQSPTLTLSLNQFEIRPSSTLLTVTWGHGSVSGALESE